MAKRISVINFKGGVGKTTFAFNFATGLVRFHQPCRVWLVDVDHQSSISIICLNAKGWQAAVKGSETTNEIFKPFIGQRTSMPDRSIITRNPLKSYSRYNNLDLVSASLELDDTEIELTASHHGNAIQSEWDKRTLICRWIEEANVDDEYDYVIFDCPPATKIISQNAIAASHGYIIPVVPEAVMERGAPHLVGMVKNGIDKRLNALASMGVPRQMHVPNTYLVGLAVTRITTAGNAASGYTNDHTQHLHSLSRQWGKKLVKPYVAEGTGVSQALGDGVPVYDRSGTQNVGHRGIDTMYRKLTDQFKTRIDAI